MNFSLTKALFEIVGNRKHAKVMKKLQESAKSRNLINVKQ
jgi:hypothetical protein